MKWIQRRADLSGVNCSQSFLDFDRFGRKCDHLGLDTLSLKKTLASCSILLRLYTPGLTPPGGSAIPKWGPGLTHLLAFHQLWLVGYTHPPKSPMGYASDACTDSGSRSVVGLLCFSWGRTHVLMGLDTHSCETMVVLYKFSLEALHTWTYTTNWQCYPPMGPRLYTPLSFPPG